MSRELKLRGYAKEIYATIFSFWMRTRSSVGISYDTFRNITGAAAPAVSNSLKLLKNRGLIDFEPKHGTRTKYKIIMTDTLYEAYCRDSGIEASSESEVLRFPKSTSNVLPSSTTVTESVNNGNTEKKMGSAQRSALSLPARNSYTVDHRMLINRK